jgi:FkbM family methyltransferase
MIAQAKALVRRIIRPPVHRAEVAVPHTVYGTEYGGWPLIDGSLDADSVILSVGLGEDISFDLEAIARFGCTVHGCDPTPRSLAWLASQQLPAAFHVHALGLGDADGPATFVPPADDRHVSYSARRGKGQTGEAITIEVCTLPTLLKRIGATRIDVLKMDIEGFEYGVIEQMLDTPIRPRQLLVEFHHRMYGYGPDDTRRSIARLNAAGYRIFYVSAGGHEYGLVHQDPA